MTLLITLEQLMLYGKINDRLLLRNFLRERLPCRRLVNRKKSPERKNQTEVTPSLY